MNRRHLLGVVLALAVLVATSVQARPADASGTLVNGAGSSYVALAMQQWVTDATAVLTGTGWLYVVAVLDRYTRCIVGWSMHKTGMPS